MKGFEIITESENKMLKEISRHEVDYADEREKLIARLFVDDDGRFVEITYLNPQGVSHVCRYIDGERIFSRLLLPKSQKADGPYCFIKDSLDETPDALKRMGPILRQQIPQDWYFVLGECLS